MDKIIQIANLYVATLRQMYLIHQYSHWTTRGENFYGDHLLFQRLYESAEEDADGAAEKMIGLFGIEAVNFKSQKDFMKQLADKYDAMDGSPVEMSLKIEKDFIKFAKSAYDFFDKEGILSLGLDNKMQDISDRREESCYLLQQVLGNSHE